MKVWVIVFIQYCNINPLSPNSLFLLPQEPDNSMEGLINIQNEDNECKIFRWCLVRNLNSVHKNLAKIETSIESLQKSLMNRMPEMMQKKINCFN